MVSKSRFKSLWRGAGTLIFILGWFIDIRLFGASSFVIALIMWITAGVIANMIYGKDPTFNEKTKGGKYHMNSSYVPGKDNSSIKNICESCGYDCPPDSRFCPECGSSL